MVNKNKKSVFMASAIFTAIIMTCFALPALAQTPCETLRENVEINTLPPGVITGEPMLTTFSDACISAEISPGDIALDYIPTSFSFPLKHFTTHVKKNFSNDNTETASIDVSTGPDDILTVHDFRNSGGFSVTITSSPFKSSLNDLPLRNLHVVTTYPDADDMVTMDPTLYGLKNGGIEYAAGSQGLQDITAGAFTEGNLNLPETYTTNGVSFDENEDDIPDVITLMETATAHIMRASQALSFYLEIPESQPAGTYEIMFTIDLITGE